ncbi:MAG: hypothetical protein AAF288_14390 [Planctomycetota bacterium]
MSGRPPQPDRDRNDDVSAPPESPASRETASDSDGVYELVDTPTDPPKPARQPPATSRSEALARIRGAQPPTPVVVEPVAEPHPDKRLPAERPSALAHARPDAPDADAGTGLDRGALAMFCRGCGSALTPESTDLAECPRCGREYNPIDAKTFNTEAFEEPSVWSTPTPWARIGLLLWYVPGVLITKSLVAEAAATRAAGPMGEITFRVTASLQVLVSIVWMAVACYLALVALGERLGDQLLTLLTAGFLCGVVLAAPNVWWVPEGMRPIYFFLASGGGMGLLAGLFRRRFV